jgi:type I restriction enzyme M protein
LLNSETKRHIDAARDVLVGVAPNPTTQIDQITYALIYKFMDDMDQASVKAGGEASFFIGDLEKYAWSKLMSTRLGNQEKMDLYSEALTKFSEAKQLPELFRTIFRAAFLPYRSPETLGLFLKEISYFDYTHPEELGNAYEYLLSIMSSQGDAGQFRTPRHIIDFIVDVINPTKDDKVLDPACGTGGFLVSTYNHILEQHDGKDDPKKKEKPLTPDERKKLMSNLQGYDIDPTMVRIAQVNMYLHQFKNPQIFQYDSLTSEERWNDKYDVILANPPFMSPKGGIKPHNKFGVASNRAEVLFVDYIINHLKPKGRAGIIVPEGIIFQSGIAYRTLRKNLVEKGLYAVVSLPGGVFQPYSGVKTSILLFDNELAKQKTEIAFVKISADGFDLGSSKRVVQRNDLPEALTVLKSWASGNIVESATTEFVQKSDLALNGDYNLSGDRYKTNSNLRNSSWPLVPLGDLVDILNGFAFKSELYTDKGTRIIRITNVQKGYIKDDEPKYYPESLNSEISKYFLKENDLLVSLTGNVGRVALLPRSFLPAALNQRVACLRVNTESRVLEKYLFHLLNLDNFEEESIKTSSGVAQKNLSTEWLKTFEIPLPPLEVQEQIVAELDGYAAIISGAKQVVDNWKPSIDVESEFKFADLGNFCRIQNGYAFSSTEMGDFKEGYLPVIKIGNVGADGIIDTNCKYHAYSKKLDNFILTDGDIVIAMTGATVGKVATIPRGKFLLNQRVGKIEMLNNEVALDYVRLALQSTKFYAFCQATATGGAQGNISADEILRFQIPLAPMDLQLSLTRAAEEEGNQVSSLRKLISTYEKRVQQVISKLWDISEGVS